MLGASWPTECREGMPSPVNFWVVPGEEQLTLPWSPPAAALCRACRGDCVRRTGGKRCFGSTSSQAPLSLRPVFWLSQGKVCCAGRQHLTQEVRPVRPVRVSPLSRGLGRHTAAASWTGSVACLVLRHPTQPWVARGQEGRSLGELEGKLHSSWELQWLLVLTGLFHH